VTTRAIGGIAATLALSVALVGCGAGEAGEESPAPAPSPTAASAPPTRTPEPVASAPATPPRLGVEPARINIPAIGVSEPLIGLGLDDEGALEVPADYFDVGWFTGGGRPGGRGPTVIAAHVNTGTAPAVFDRLDELVVGDIVEVTDVEGTVVPYVVSDVADYAKARFPTARVFGATAEDELRLITCAGLDSVVSEYLDNRVVSAVRADAAP
jgi:LPXTG-site transpeptidase (sortase) family protein